MEMTRRAMMPLVFAAAVALAADPAAATADGPDAYRVVDVASWDVLNMRAGPGTRYRIIGAIPHDGTGIENIGDHVAGWTRVRYGGQIGWVSNRYLAEDSWVAPVDSGWRVVGVAHNDVLNLRTGPSTGHAIVGFIPPNASGVEIIGACSGHWCQVRYHGVQGWASTRYLTPAF